MEYRGCTPLFQCRATLQNSPWGHWDWGLHPLRITVQLQLFPPQACCPPPRPGVAPESAPDKLAHRLISRPGKGLPEGNFGGNGNVHYLDYAIFQVRGTSVFSTTPAHLMLCTTFHISNFAPVKQAPPSLCPFAFL